MRRLADTSVPEVVFVQWRERLKVKYIARERVAFEESKDAWVVSRRANYEDREWRTVNCELCISKIRQQDQRASLARDIVAKNSLAKNKMFFLALFSIWDDENLSFPS